MASRRKTRSNLSESLTETSPNVTRSGRECRPPNNHQDYILASHSKTTPSKGKILKKSSESDDSSSSSSEQDNSFKGCSVALKDFSNNDVAGSEVYQFNTPKKRDGMKRKAENTPKSPATVLSRLSLNSPKTPHTFPALRTQNFATPTETRKRIKEALTKEKQRHEELESESSADEHSDYEAEESSDSDTSDSDNSGNVEATSSDDDDDDDFEKPKQIASKRNVASKQKSVELPRAGVATRGRSKKNPIEEDFIPDSDNYFLTAANKKSKTSDHTLDRLKSSRLQHDELFSLLNSIHASAEHQQRIAEMLDGLRQNFDRWWREMQRGYNIIVYGMGSKQQLLYEFCEMHLHDRPLIIVNGFFPSLTVKDILQSIKVQLLEITTNSRGDHETVDVIASTLTTMPDAHIFIVINNIDGVMLRKTKDQHIISRLAKINQIHLIASIDHINAPLMWDQTCMDNFNFIWYDCTTMLPYKNETAFENSVFFQNSGELDLAAMNNVFRSLTTNARGIYMILVKNQLANAKDSNYQGMTFKKLYQKCREGFLVSSDSTLRTQLIEFVDHKMAKIKRGHDATELISIPISTHILTLFTQQQAD